MNIFVTEFQTDRRFLRPPRGVSNDSLGDKQDKKTSADGEEIVSDPKIGLQFATEPVFIIIKEDATNYVEIRLSKDYGYEVTVKQNGIGIENGIIQNGGNIINVEQVN